MNHFDYQGCGLWRSAHLGEDLLDLIVGKLYVTKIGFVEGFTYDRGDFIHAQVSFAV